MRIGLATAILATAMPAAAVAGPIAPHRAIYDLVLDGRSDNSKLAAVEGRLAFEVSEAGCDGWTVNFRMANRYSPMEGPVRVIDTQSTSYESVDGAKFDYSEKTFVNQKLDSETRLKVTRDSASADGAGSITLPDNKDFTVEAGALFPLQHQVKIMASARNGTGRDASVVFDGSEKEKPVRTITFIGKEKSPGNVMLRSGNAQLDPLRSLRAWPVTMSYYATGDGEEETPNYSITFDLFENGVATSLRMDYGTFKMRGELSQLELFDPETCD